MTDNPHIDTPQPLVSIVMPAYNSERYIMRSIRSVQAQTYPHWELLIVDDCSSDRTAQEVNRIAATDSRIHYSCLPSNAGAAVARNTALRQAKGTYIAFLDADDEWRPEKLQRQLQFMLTHGYDYTYTAYHRDDISKRIFGPRAISKRMMEAFCWIGCSTVMYNCEHIGLIQIHPIRKNNDYAMWLQVCKKATCYLLDEDLTGYHRHANSISNESPHVLLKWHYRLWRSERQCNPIAALLHTIENGWMSIYKKIHYYAPLPPTQVPTITPSLRTRVAQSKVSIVIPCYNASRYLDEAIQSIMAQTHTNWELFIVDDCSNDNGHTWQACNAWAQKDERIRVLQTPHNAGAGVARNMGIQAATGDFVTFLDADDYWYPNKLEHQVAFMLQNDYAFTCTYYAQSVRTLEPTRTIKLPYRQSFATLRTECHIGTPGVMYKREHLADIRMPEYRYAEDWGTWLRLIQYTGCIYCLPEVMWIYRKTADSASSHRLQTLRDIASMYQQELHISKLHAFLLFALRYMPRYMLWRLKQ